MIKGVSRKVVEINNPDSIYFEKAIFYLKPHMSDIPAKLLAKEAENYMFTLSQQNTNTERNNKFKNAFPFICVILSIVVLIAGSIYSLYNF
jgi:hypothetical protein